MKKENTENNLFELPGDLSIKVKDRQNVDNSPLAQKKRLEGQLDKRLSYINLLKEKCKFLEQSILDMQSNPTPNTTEKLLILNQRKIDLHNCEIEVSAQENVFLDTHLYYKHDFMKRYSENKGDSLNMFADSHDGLKTSQENYKKDKK